MDKQTTEIFNKPWFAFLCGGLLGIIAFIVLYGVQVLDPTYVRWIFDNENPTDLSQHYFGWAFFRNGEWMWPLGMTNTLSYPMTSSVIFTDSIPHWALFFKMLSPLLPETFQYFGWFGLTCFFMQGAMGALIVKEFTGNTTYAIIASVFFIFATPLPRRMFIHTALGAQWLILLSLYLYLRGGNLTLKQSVLLWTLTLWMAAGTHIILLAICCIILFFSALRTLKQYRFWPSLLLGIPVLVAAFTVYLMGGLSSGTNPVESTNNGGGLGWYGVNVNMLINPIYDANSTFLCQLSPSATGPLMTAIPIWV